MKDSASRNDSLIAASYRDNFERVVRYIDSRINNTWDAENLAQDVWVRILTCGSELTPETMVSFIFAIARNLVNDYIRHYYCVRESHEALTLEASSMTVDSPESAVSAADLAAHEMKRVECLPDQRRTIYVMSRFEGKRVDEIADYMSLSLRTVENHLRLGRRDVRTYLAAIA